VCYGFYVFLAHWIWYGRGIQESFMILISCLSIFFELKSGSKHGISKSYLPNVVLIIVFSAMCLIGIIKASSHKYLIADLKAMLGTVIVSVGIILTFKKFIKGEIDLLDILRKFLVVYVLVNDLIIIVQYFVPYFLMNRSAIVSIQNTLYFDQLTGFFGINGTTRWNIWSTLLLLLNFHYAYNGNNKKQMRYTVVLFIYSAVIASLNSARSYFVVAPLTIVVYMLIKKRMALSKRMKQILWILLLVLVLYVVYLVNPYVNNYIKYLITDKFSVYLSLDLDYMVRMNDDRAKALAYAIQSGGNYGVGIGAVAMHSSTNDVKYIGLNSTSAYILMLGTYGYLLYTFILARFGLFGNKENGIIRTVIYFIFFVILSYCLPIYSSMAIFPAVMLMVYIFSLG
jgi:hypothetical protein